jgi:predicted aspartyl protease
VFFARATIDGRGPFWLTVDTGATLTVLDPATVAGLGLTTRPSDVRPDVGVGAGTTRVATASGAAIRAGAAEPFHPSPLYVVGVREAEAALGHRIDGVLGHDFLEQYVVEFDYREGRVRLHPPGTIAGGGAAPVAMLTSGNRVVVVATLHLSDGARLAARLLVDTGSSSGISLNSPFAGQHGLEARFPSTELSAAVGVNGMTVRSVMYLTGVSIGATELPVTRVALSRDRTGLSASTEFDGVIGAAVLRHFTVVVDYHRQELTLR